MQSTGPHLVRASLAYLAAPAFLFFGFWVRFPFNLGAVVLLAVAVARAWPRTQPGEETFRARLAANRRALWMASVALGAVLLFCGTGGVRPQVIDWPKHNAVLASFIDSPWPAFTLLDGSALPVIYYPSFYLPAALMGKVTHSWQWANAALFAWGLAGALLAWLWFSRIVGRRNGWVLALFLAASGPDVLVRGFVMLAQLAAGYDVSTTVGDLEWQVEGLQFSSVLTALTYVPQHALGGWIAAGLAWQWGQVRTLPLRSGVLVVMAALWSPFAAVGVGIVTAAYSLADRDWRYSGPDNLVVAPLAIAIALFYTALDSDLPGGWYFTLPFALHHNPAYYAFLWAAEIFCECALFVLIIRWTGLAESRDLRVLAGLILGVALVTTRVMGVGNDWGMRTTIPALFIVLAFWTRSLLSPDLSAGRRRVMVALALVCAITPLQLVIHLATLTGPLSASRSLNEVPRFNAAVAAGSVFRPYYFGNPAAPFFEYLAPPRPAVRVP